MTFDWRALLELFHGQPAMVAAVAAVIVTAVLQLLKKAGAITELAPAKTKLWIAFAASALGAIIAQLLATVSGPFDMGALIGQLLIIFFGSGIIYRVVVKPVVTDGNGG